MGLVSEGFLIDTLECLPLVFYGLLWNFPNMKETQGGIFFISLRLLGIIFLLDSPRRDFKDKWFSLWCQNRSPLLSYTRSPSVDHSLSMYYLLRSTPIAYFSTSYRLVGIWDGLLVEVRRYYPEFRILYWTKIRTFQVSPHRASLVNSSGVENMGGSETF